MYGLGSVKVQEILELVTRAAKTAAWVCKKQGEERFGGYFCLTDHNGRILLLCPVLEVRHERYRLYAEEKALRLAIWNFSHVSSWQSRDDTQKKYGGAIRGNKYVYSFSGFLELVNEAMMIAVAKELSDLSDERVTKIVEESKNSFYEAFHKEFFEPVYTMI